MTLSDLSLAHFRSYTKRTFIFAPTTTLIIGPNTAGKTNILEAIMMIATGKSFRADRDIEMIQWGNEIARINAQCAMRNDMTKLEVRLTPTKKYLVNGVARRQIDFIGNLRAVLFWPEHLELVTDSPSIRRKYMDGVLVQVDREYRRNMMSYERGLRQRNRLLDLINEGKATRAQLLFWNQLLIRSGGYLTDKRAEFIHFVNSFQSSIVSYQIEYDKSVISESRLEQYKDEEVAAKATLVGPHRDDFVVTKNDLDLSKYGSRGEQRLAILWLKLAELAFIERESGERPLLLLDDIFSELDVEHRTLVLDLLDKQQTIVTSAEEEVADLFKKHNISADIIRL
jgi:DNA replication and repair protein RecF